MAITFPVWFALPGCSTKLPVSQKLHKLRNLKVARRSEDQKLTLSLFRGPSLVFPPQSILRSLANITRDDIDSLREKAIRTVIDRVQALIITYRGSKVQCDADVQFMFLTTISSYPYSQQAVRPFAGNHRQECDALIYGQLERICRKIGIEPAPFGTYDGFTLKALCSQISRIELRSLCDRINEVRPLESRIGHPRPTGHNIKETLTFDVNKVLESVAGLNIVNYKRPEWIRVKTCEERAIESDEELWTQVWLSEPTPSLETLADVIFSLPLNQVKLTWAASLSILIMLATIPGTRIVLYYPSYQYTNSDGMCLDGIRVTTLMEQWTKLISHIA